MTTGDYDSDGLLPQVRAIPSVISVSPEILADLLAPSRVMTPEERAARDTARAAWVTAALAAHHQVTAVSTGLASQVADLHSPRRIDWHPHLVCQGCECDGSSMDCQSPAWPCDTYALVADATGVEIPGRTA